nr:hypothetical protein B0A51_15002 [Rachicladosporium sp. CCFEE 5018]
MTKTAEDDTLLRTTRSSLCLKKTLSRVLKTISPRHEPSTVAPPPKVHVAASLHESDLTVQEYLAQPDTQRGTVLYLAYGSNLSNETFRGKRGIKPLSQVNVQVPSLRLTFDLPGLPYAEPCFANSGTRDAEKDRPSPSAEASASEKTPLLVRQPGSSEYRKDSWHKGLVGVVYEVTPEDYAHIIATEGGGASYHDILVDCHAFASSDPATSVPQSPTLPAFKAHTLFAPAAQDGDGPPKEGGRFQRPDTSYAQPSARYLKLITDGAAECGLPYEYQDYLHALRPYTLTSNKQRIGQFVFLSIWLPFIMLCFALGRQFADKDGLTPTWLRQLTAAIFKGCWMSYDGFFKPLFSDGERSIPDGGDEAPEVKSQRRTGETPTEYDVEKAG